MSGKYSGLKKASICSSTSLLRACDWHNLQLMLKVAMETVTETDQFQDTIDSVYNFFSRSIVRWQKLQNLYNRSFSNLTLKVLNSTRWSDLYDAVYAAKERFYDVMKCLTHIIRISTKPKE